MRILIIYIVFGFAFLQSTATIAQTTAEAFLSQLPPIPKTVCYADTSVINHFIAQIDKVRNAMDADCDRLSNKTRANLTKNREKIFATNAANLGLNMTDMNKLLNENTTEKEGLVVANKSVETLYGTSVNELQKVADMSEEEQEKWAKEFANRQMQKAQQNPEATAKKAERNKRLYDLGTEQKVITERLSQIWRKMGNVEKNYQYQDSVQGEILKKKLEPLEKDPVLLGGCMTSAELQRARTLRKQIFNLQIQHCEKMSPLLLDYILQYQTALKISFPDYRRLTEIANELSEIQNGVNAIPIQFVGINVVAGYADHLTEAYKYWIPKDTY